MATITTSPGVIYHVINSRTNKLLSFGGVETVARHIHDLRSIKTPTPMIVIKSSPTGSKIIELIGNLTFKDITDTITDT